MYDQHGPSKSVLLGDHSHSGKITKITSSFLNILSPVPENIYWSMCLSYTFLPAVIKYPEKSNLKEKGFISAQRVRWQSLLWEGSHSSWESFRDRELTAARVPDCCVHSQDAMSACAQLSVLFLYSPRSKPREGACPQWSSLPSSVISISIIKIPHRHAQWPLSQVIPDLIKLTTEMNHHSD